MSGVGFSDDRQFVWFLSRRECADEILLPPKIVTLRRTRLDVREADFYARFCFGDRFLIDASTVRPRPTEGHAAEG